MTLREAHGYIFRSPSMTCRRRLSECVSCCPQRGFHGHCSLMMTNLERSLERSDPNLCPLWPLSLPFWGSLVDRVVRYFIIAPKTKTKTKTKAAITFSNYSNDLLHTMLQFCGPVFEKWACRAPLKRRLGGLFNSFFLSAASGGTWLIRVHLTDNVKCGPKGSSRNSWLQFRVIPIIMKTFRGPKTLSNWWPFQLSPLSFVVSVNELIKVFNYMNMVASHWLGLRLRSFIVSSLKPG